MSASFASASSQRLLCATHPLVAYPYTVGMWVRPTTTGALKTVFFLGDFGSGNQFNRINQTAADTWGITAAAGGTENGGTAVGTVTANKWTFIIGRFVSATSRRAHVLQFDGSIVNPLGTTSRAFPTSAETISLGSIEISTPAAFFDGQIAEFWYTNTDVVIDGGTTIDAAMLRQLAWGGPFSLPHIRKDIIEYRSLWSGLTSAQDQGTEVYWGAFGRQTWTNTGGVTLGPHPPLPGGYRNPRDALRLGMV